MTQIWAHRGSSVAAPENTLEAFEQAMRDGADGIEFDVQLTADGEVVVCHDETIDRTSDGTGAIVDMTLADLRQHRYNNGMPGFDCQIPTLGEVLDLAAGGDVLLNVELKNSVEPYPGLEAAVETVVARSPFADQAPDRLLYSSFNHRSLHLLATSGTQVPLGVLHVELLVKSWEYARVVGASALHPHWGALGDDEVDACHEAGLAVNAWTVDEPEVMRLMARLGVDAIITNVPAQARVELGRV